MLKRRLEESSEKLNLRPDTTLPHHPLNFLIPTQPLFSLALPFAADIPSETIVFSQDDINQDISQDDLIQTDLWKSEDPDLKYVRFRKPILKNFDFCTSAELTITDDLKNSKLLSGISPVTKRDYVRSNLDFKKSILPDFESDSQLLNKVLEMFSVDAPENDSGLPLGNISRETSIKPEFTYDSRIAQTALLTHSREELSRYIKIIGSFISKPSDYDLNDDVNITYQLIFPDPLTLIKPEVLCSVRSRILDLISTNSQVLINLEDYTKVAKCCLDIIKDLFAIEWESIFQTEQIYNTDEYQSAQETIVYACSILLILYSDKFTCKAVQNEKGIPIVVDSITAFAGMLKFLYKNENFSELPDFFIPFIKHFRLLLTSLCDNFHKIKFDESSITRLEYISFDIIFAEIVQKRDRANLNNCLEEIRMDFAKILICIYSKYENQRHFLLNEIIENINSLTPLKSKSKNVRLKSGQTVQLTSYLILKLIESHNKYGMNFDFTQWMFLNTSHRTKAETAQLKEIEIEYWNSVKFEAISMQKAINYFSSHFIKKIMNTYTPNLRKIVENFIADFTIMLTLPEFPASPYLINSLLNVCFEACNAAEISSAHALLFEIIGIFGSTILSLKKEITIPILNHDIPPSSFLDLSNNYVRLLLYLKFKEKKRESEFKFISLQLLHKLNEVSEALKLELKCEKEILIGDTLKGKKCLLKQIDSTIIKIRDASFESENSVDMEITVNSECRQLYLYIVLSNDVISRYSDILTFILSSLNNPKIKSRTMAIKNLTLLVDREPVLFEDIELRNMLKLRLKEASATIIDATLDLLQKVLTCKLKYIPEFYDVISLKIQDPSINVKRKSVNLIQHMFLSTDDFAIKVHLSRALLSQLDDEDDRIVDLVCSKLALLLFLNVTSKDSTQLQNKTEIEAISSVRVLTGIYVLGQSTWNHFERFIYERVIYIGDFNERIGALLKESLSIMVDTIISLVTDTSDFNVAEKDEVSKEAVMAILATFVKYDQKLISQSQLVAIQPYIVNDYGVGELCYHTLQVLNMALNHHKTLNKVFVNTCKDSLMKRLTNFNSKELDQSIQCLWKLSMLDNDTSGVTKACISSLRFLLKYIAQMQLSIKNFQPDAAVPRLLYLIGNFGRYCKFERDRAMFMDANLGLRETENISVFLLKFVLKFCDSSILKPIRKIAIKNALNICISHPKLFFSVPIIQLIDSAFKKKDSEITDLIIGAFLIFLEDEETKIIKKNGLDVKRSSSVQLDIAVFHGYSLEYVNDGICSTIAQKYLTNILDSCLNPHLENSLNAIKFLKIVVKFGFSNPKICFPTVVALECSKSGYVRHMALELHKFLFDKFETLIESAYSEAFKTASKYIVEVYKMDELHHCSFFLKSFFKIVYERNNKQRADKFLQAILRAFSNISTYKFQRMNERELITIQYQIFFLCINLNEMEFKRQLDLLKVINHIEKIVLREENMFGEQFNLLMDMFDDDDDKNEKFKYLVMAKVLVVLKCLIKCLMANYGISPELILKYQENTEKKDFLSQINRIETNKFFVGETKTLLTKPVENQLTLLHKKLVHLSKN